MRRDNLTNRAAFEAWQLAHYERLVDRTDGRRAYLQEISGASHGDDQCPANRALPEDLVREYFQDGAQLKCPEGTISRAGAQCLGECRKPEAQREPISILDPVDAGSLSEAARRFDENDFDSEGKPLYDPVVYASGSRRL